MISDKALWYLARGTGVVSLILLTSVVVLGIVSHHGSVSPRVPRFAAALLHRNLSLLAIAFLVVHIASSVLDPFAGIAWTDAIVPLRASYRPLWLGSGALALDLLLALAITSLLRARIGLRTWRALHWLAYACWPLALLHGLGTGTDVRAGWLLVIAAGCVAATAAAATWRIARTRAFPEARRRSAIAAVLLAPLLVAGWLESGPLAPGWAGRAGTPAHLLHRTSSRTPAISSGTARTDRTTGAGG